MQEQLPRTFVDEAPGTDLRRVHGSSTCSAADARTIQFEAT